MNDPAPGLGKGRSGWPPTNLWPGHRAPVPFLGDEMEFLSEPVNWFWVAAMVAWFLLQGRGEVIWKAVDTWLNGKDKNARHFEHQRWLLSETKRQELLLKHLTDRTKRLLEQDPGINPLREFNLPDFGLQGMQGIKGMQFGYGLQQDPLVGLLGNICQQAHEFPCDYTELAGLDAATSSDDFLRGMQQG